MNLKEVLITRRTIHDFAAEPIDEKILAEAVECARWAPNHKLTFPWRFFRLNQNHRQRLWPVFLQLKQKPGDAPLSQAMLSNMEKKFMSPAELLVVATVATSDPVQSHEDYASLAMAIQNMSLYLWKFGIGSKWSTGKISRHKMVFELIGQGPENIRLEGFLWVGKPAATPAPPRRPELSEIYTVL